MNYLTSSRLITFVWLPVTNKHTHSPEPVFASTTMIFKEILLTLCYLIETILSIPKSIIYCYRKYKSPIPCFLINKINIVGITNVTNDFPIQNCNR